MRIKHRYALNYNESIREIIDFLKVKKIKYDDSYAILIVEIYEDNPDWSNLNDLMIKYDASELIECVYTPKEISSAKWLRIRSKWRSEYPQPEDGYEKVTYDLTQYCSGCGCQSVQNDYFRLKRTPKWGKRNFLMIHWVESELFVHDEVVKLIMQEELKGFDFLPVLKYKSNEPLDNIKQIKVLNTLNFGMILKDEDIKKVLKCPKCNSKKYILSGRAKIVFNKEIFEGVDVDMVKSKEAFGDGLLCSQKIIISQKMYRVLCKYGLQKELAVEPITLV